MSQTYQLMNRTRERRAGLVPGTRQVGHPVPAPISKIWMQYAVTRDPALRDQLILENVTLVKRVIDRMAISLPPCLEYEDLVSHGIIGLMQAIDRYDPNRGVPFAVYATTRIRGQVLDTLRRMDLVPRSVRQRAREIEDAIRMLRDEEGTAPNEKEIAAYLGITEEAVRTNLQNAAFVLVSIDNYLFQDNREFLPLSEQLEDEQTITPAEYLEGVDIRERLREALRGLSLYHEKELTRKESGRVLGVSESRISQIYSKAILTLRAAL